MWPAIGGVYTKSFRMNRSSNWLCAKWVTLQREAYTSLTCLSGVYSLQGIGNCQMSNDNG